MKWPSWTNAVLGVWLILAPFALRYASPRATVEDIVFGLIIGGLALWRALGPETPPMRTVSAIVALAGLWVAIAPFALGYSTLVAAVRNDVFVGLLVLILGGIRALAPVGQPVPR